MSKTSSKSKSRSLDITDDLDVNRKLSIIKYRKKQAANDAQLLMNRIALLQKEEERARKKVDSTKARALDILSMREENENRMKEWTEAAEADRKMREEVHARNFVLEEQSRLLKKELADRQIAKKKESVESLRSLKVEMRQELVQMKEEEIKRKQEKRRFVRDMEEEARRKREEAERLHEAEVRKFYEDRAAEEAKEAKRAEKLVKKLEKKEKEWIDKLRTAQHIQEITFIDLENTLVRSPEKNNNTNTSSFPTEGFDLTDEEMYQQHEQQQHQHQHQQAMPQTSSGPNSSRSGGRLSPLAVKKKKEKKEKSNTSAVVYST